MSVLLVYLISLYTSTFYKVNQGEGMVLLELYPNNTEYYTILVATQNDPPTVKVQELIYEGDKTQNPNIFILNPVKYFGITLYPVLIKNTKDIASLTLEIRYNLNIDAELPKSIKEALKGIVVNIDAIKEGPPGGYVIIVPDVLYNDFQPLARWKELVGYTVFVKKHSEFNPLNTATIKSYILNLWNLGNPRPEFVLLVDTTTPSFRIPVFNEINFTDLPYGQIDEDIFPEILVSRVVASNRAQAITIVKKIIEYEKNPLRGGSNWFKRALVIGANYPSFMTSPIPVKKKIREEMLKCGYTAVDTVFWGSGYTQTTQDILNSVNAGVSFINYRGGDADPWQWIYPTFRISDIQNLSNGWKLPIITSIVCNTARFNHPQCFGNNWLIAGDTINPKGAVAFYGATTPTTHTRWNNCMDYGFYGGLLYDNINTLGSLTLRSKFEIYKNFYDGTQANMDSIAYNFYAYNLLGDPSLMIWTDTPESLHVIHPSSIPIGIITFSVRILDRNSTPVKKALVCIYKPGIVKQTAYTDELGVAIFTVENTSQDSIFITVTAKNKVPYLGKITVQNMNYIGYQHHFLSDETVNNDGNLNPGERANLYISIKNFSSTNASNVTVNISSQDSNLTILNGVLNIGNINAGEVVQIGPFTIQSASNIPDGYQTNLMITISSSIGNFEQNFHLKIHSPAFQIDSIFTQNTKEFVNPGDSVGLVVLLTNTGSQNAINVHAKLTSCSQFLSVIDSTAYFGNINSGSQGINQDNPFKVYASSLTPSGIVVKCTLEIITINFSQKLPLNIRIGPYNSQSPLGPDSYGYYAYDNTENHAEAPSFAWIEIDPTFGGPGITIPLTANDIKTMDLPFTFKFYGVNYSKISISSEGYVVMGEWAASDRYNWILPSFSAPPALIAPFWDDMNPQAGGRVCYYFDANNNRFIVEWSRVPRSVNVTDTLLGACQTFQVILLDPVHHPTLTGDGIILFQYLEISNEDTYHKYATVGIQDHTHTKGLLYTYNNEYPPEAAPLGNQRAIKITTDPPGVTNLANSNRKAKLLKENIAKNKLQLNYTLVSYDSEIFIFDYSGRVVEKFSAFEINQSNWLVPIMELKPGIYFIFVRAENRFIIEKFIKTN
ncbi:MAG: C25 family cysteine peptidase [candidate division WOR-3 bacterium]